MLPVRVGARVVAAALGLTGCSALLGVNEIFFDANAVAGGGGGGDGSPEGSTTDGPPGDGGADAFACMADFQNDKKNCGRCGRDCFGGACDGGKCDAVELASVPGAPLFHLVVSPQHAFVSTSIGFTTENGGIWRIPKGGGAAEAYVTIRYAQDMAVLGDKLYFVVNDAPANGADTHGGFYSCPLVGASPCAPTLIAVATNPRGITLDQNRVFYGDALVGKGMMVYAPPAPPTVFRADFGFPYSYYVDGTSAFYSVTTGNALRHAKVLEVFADGGVDEKYFYEGANAADARLQGNASFLLFTAFDYQTQTGGVVRRIPRGGSAPCDYGGNGNKRPYGVYSDATHIYWTNQGDGAKEPYLAGSLATCDLAGCCTTPDILWTGDGRPTAVTGDADAVYFTTKAKGSLWKIAKP